MFAVRAAFVSAALLFGGSAQLLFAANPNIGQLIRINTRQTRIVGETIDSNDAVIRLRNLKTEREESYNRADVAELITDPTDQEMSSSLTPAQILAYRASKALSGEARSGKIASVDGGSVYLNLGTNHGVKVGDQFIVYRGSMEIRDPTTNELIGVQQKKLGKIEVLEAEEKFSKAKLLDELETQLMIGDQVKPASKVRAIAILPLLSEDGSISKGSLALADELTTRMTGAGFTVVERSQLLRVFGELGLQQSALFDETTSKVLGKQVGASFILIGRALRLKTETSLSLRLVDVESGKIVLASSIKPSSYDHAMSISKALSSPLGVKNNLPGGDVGGDGGTTKSKEIEAAAKSDAAEFLRKSGGDPNGNNANIARSLFAARRKGDSDGKGDIWSNNVVSFENLGSNQWKETGRNFTNYFTETARTANYVELVRGDGSRKNPYVLVRIYEDRVWIKQPNEPTFSEVYRGSWAQRGEKSN
ncbi:hypothetical protein AYO47_05780 [Planctomyces sp. SCGC AG-212-M04]|nr:hypothetical protein AYO47_05780 [Planctomyces sp. SCGC AG-212-M04]